MTKTKKPYHNLIGNRYGRLVVLSLVETPAGANTPTKWLCQCDCGQKVEVTACNLKSGNTCSCGCLQKDHAANAQKKHGQTGTRLYVIWQHIIARCNRTSDRAYKWYGDRGIAICDEWRRDFQAFYDWSIKNGYGENLTIDRIDVNGNYCPDNCRWITLSEQQKNKRDNVLIEYDGETKKACEWAEIFGCRPQSVYREILIREGRVHKCGQKD